MQRFAHLSICNLGFCIGILASAQTPVRFIPEGYTSQDRSLVDQSVQKRLSKTLLAMDEPSLWEAPSVHSSFRFTWLRTFDEPISIRIQKVGNTYSVRSTILAGKGGYELGGIKSVATKSVPRQKWDELVTLINESSFWELAPSLEPQFKDHLVEVSTDGASWILEGSMNHRYHLVSRHSPENQKYRRLCLFLLQISGIAIKPSAIY